MTRAAAIGAAAGEAVKFGTVMAVYRFPAWPADVYGVRAADQLPREALTFERFDPPAAAIVVTESAPPAAGQGSLF